MTADLSSSATAAAAADAAYTAAEAMSGLAANTDGAGDIVQFGFGGKTYVAVEVNGNGAFNASTDMLVDITGFTGTLSAADFVA